MFRSMELHGYQRKYLSSKAHHLQPVVMIGGAGLTEGVIGATREALEHHELIKVKFVDYKEERDSLSKELAEASGAYLVRVIGNMAILYKENDDPDKRQYRIPVRN